MSYSEDKFRAHIQEVVKASEFDDNRALTLDELRELALSMGLTDREWQDLLIKAEVSLNTALAHLRVQNYTDAIQSAEEATSINPYIKDGNAILAQCYLKLAYVEKNQELFAKAEQYARMELKNDPLDGPALNVISAVEAEKQEGKTNKRSVKLAAYAGGGILLLFVVFFMCNRGESTVQSTNNGTLTNSDIVDLSANVESTESIYSAAIQRRNEMVLELLGAVQDEDLKNDLQKSVSNYDFDNIKDSESNLKIAWGNAKSTGYFNDADLVNMEGQTNRIATAKKRYLESVANYNSYLKNNKENLAKEYKLIDLNE